MPPKRKAPSTLTDIEPPATRRRTRATAAEPSIPAAAPTVPTRRGRPPGKKAATLPSFDEDSAGEEKRNPRHYLPVQDNSTHSDNDADELLLSPSKRRSQAQKTPPRTNAPRMIMHSVEIVTPRHRNKPRTIARSPSQSPQPTQSRKRPNVTNASSLPLFPPPVPLQPLTNTPATPSRRTRTLVPLTSPARPHTLPEHLHSCLHAQKRAMLTALRNPLPVELERHGEDDSPANAVALRQLRELLLGTVERGEGNSCLLIGPRGSGKSCLIEVAITTLSQTPIVIRLSGHVQQNDRLAMREIARQLAKQTESTIVTELDTNSDEDANPFVETDPSVALPPSTHLPALISALPTLSRPTIVILDSFDLFALHGRQALLYCLLDTAQSCRAGKGSKGIVVIGTTTRVDTINLLEKRVKSRFSGRILRTAPPTRLSDWNHITRAVLCAPVETKHEEWADQWSTAVGQFLAERAVKESFADIFGITRDVRKLSQILTALITSLSPARPFPTASLLSAATAGQCGPPSFPFLSASPYPVICLLIASIHAETAGHDAVTFEMLYESFRTQLRTSLSAPVQVEGGGIGMVRCSREVLMTAFEHLVSTRVFVPLSAASTNTRREFVRHKCMVERDVVKKVIEANGQTNLKKWFSKAQ